MTLLENDQSPPLPISKDLVNTDQSYKELLEEIGRLRLHNRNLTTTIANIEDDRRLQITIRNATLRQLQQMQTELKTLKSGTSPPPPLPLKDCPARDFKHELPVEDANRTDNRRANVAIIDSGRNSPTVARSVPGKSILKLTREPEATDKDSLEEDIQHSDARETSWPNVGQQWGRRVHFESS